MNNPAHAQRVWPRLAFALVPCCLAQGCVSDTQLLAGNATPAVETAKNQATSELSCPGATGSIRSQRVVQGAPLGYLWSGYIVAASGCGRQSIYDVTCLNDQLCSANKL